MLGMIIASEAGRIAATATKMVENFILVLKLFFHENDAMRMGNDGIMYRRKQNSSKVTSLNQGLVLTSNLLFPTVLHLG